MPQKRFTGPKCRVLLPREKPQTPQFEPDHGLLRLAGLATTACSLWSTLAQPKMCSAKQVNGPLPS